MSEVSTSNMGEALHLLQGGARVTALWMASSWPAVILEGETAQEDHLRYVAQKVRVELCDLPELFSAIAKAIENGGAL